MTDVCVQDIVILFMDLWFVFKWKPFAKNCIHSKNLMYLLLVLPSLMLVSS